MIRKQCPYRTVTYTTFLVSEGHRNPKNGSRSEVCFEFCIEDECAL
jgi:hypothetical protein